MAGACMQPCSTSVAALAATMQQWQAHTVVQSGQHRDYNLTAGLKGRGGRLDAPAGCSHTDLAQLARPPAAAIFGALRHSSNGLRPAMGCSKIGCHQ